MTYLHPLLEPYLEKTYGIFVYQEDIMAAAMALGVHRSEADTLGLCDPQEEVERCAQEKFVTQAAAGRRPGVIDAVPPRSSRSRGSGSTRPTPPATG